jgi:hypothetical protein
MTNVPGSYQSNAQNDDGAMGELVTPSAGGAVESGTMFVTVPNVCSFDTNAHNNSFRRLVVPANQIDYTGSALLELNTATGILTFVGESSRAAWCILVTSFFPSVATADPTVAVGITKGTDLVGLGTEGNVQTAAGVSEFDLFAGAGPAQPAVCVTSQRRMTLPSEGTLGAVAAKEVGTGSLTVVSLQLTVFLL